MFNLPHRPSPKSKSLFELQQLRRGVRPPLSLRQQLHRQTQLPLLRLLYRRSHVFPGSSNSKRNRVLPHPRQRQRGLNPGHRNMQHSIWDSGFADARFPGIPLVPGAKGEDHAIAAEEAIERGRAAKPMVRRGPSLVRPLHGDN